jgi:hypothetical protein
MFRHRCRRRGRGSHAPRPRCGAAWKQESQDRYRYTIDPVRLAKRDGETILTATLAGDFPGGPVELDYEFRIVDDAIETLSIRSVS